MARLLFVTGTSPDVRGGSGTYVGISVLRKAVEARGHTVDLLAPSARGPLSLARRLLFNLSARNVARSLRPDVVVGFDLDGFLIRGSGAQQVASIKGVIAEEARFERGIARTRLTVEAFLERRHVRRSTRILATSQHSASRIAADYAVPRERIAVVPEPIDLARWRVTLNAAEEPHAKRSILCVAHLYPRKDVATLLHAMTRLPNDVHLRVVGTGPERARLERLARDLALLSRVAFLGHVGFQRLAAEYRSADVFCLPSRQEGFGIVFLEAMAASLPIVAAHASAVPEVVADGECGLLVPPGDAEALASALHRLSDDPDERRRLGSAGGQRVERFDAPRVAREFLEALEIFD